MDLDPDEDSAAVDPPVCVYTEHVARFDHRRPYTQLMV